MTVHRQNIQKYDGSTEQLSEDLGNLYYDALADFLHTFSQKILDDGNGDFRRNRPKLAGRLMACSKLLEQASSEIQQAWLICQPYAVNTNKGKKLSKHSRTSRVDIAKQTLQVMEQGYYQNKANQKIDLKERIANCVAQTQLYTPDDLATLVADKTCQASTIEVINETTLQAAKRLYATGDFNRIGVLNFASAKNAGGGFLGGSQAQEETLARSSALYASLQQCPDYYQYHRHKQKSLLYSNHMIYTPDCPIFKDDQGDFLDQPYEVDFITSPAPNRGALARNEPDSLNKIDDVFSQRIHLMLTLALSQGCDALILGAWGCGVFGNDPEHVAGLFAQALAQQGDFENVFTHVSFSIPEHSKAMMNTQAFQNAFATRKEK